MSEASNAGAVIVGCFMVVVGLCLGLLGGGCSVLLLMSASAAASGGTGLAGVAPLLLISLAMLAGGGALAWVGIKLMTGKLGAPPPPPAP
jgi:hypothetical protein